MNKKDESFLEKIDNMFLFSEEMIQGNGEDNFCCNYTKNSAFMGVFDGCGGLGSRVYGCFKNHTGAYMASRIVSGAVYDWYRANGACHWKDARRLADIIKKYIQSAFSVCDKYVIKGGAIKGTMVKSFPTTLAMIYLEDDDDGVLLHVLWAGDSRIYLLDGNGLAQLSIDDVENRNAMTNLRNDGALNNLIFSDGDYMIHTKTLHLTETTSLIVCTDGCFGYVPTPMEFEYLLLSKLIESNSTDIFQNGLKQEIREFAGDDFTFGMLNLFYGDFNLLKKSFENRIKQLYLKFIVPLEKCRTDEMMENLWKEYRKGYERYWHL